MNSILNFRYLRLVPCALWALASGAVAAPAPAWWSESGTAVLSPSVPLGDYAPANLGQLKHVASMARHYLDAKLGSGPGGAGLGGAGTAITLMTGSFTSIDNYAPVNIGQLKNVAKPFYDRLADIGYNWRSGNYGVAFPKYPWVGTVHDENASPANIGQLKNVFAFELTASYCGQLTDTDGDEIPDFWEVHHQGGLPPAQQPYALTAITAAGDLDGDGLTNIQEFRAGTDPFEKDSDGDFAADGLEIWAGLNPADSGDLASDYDGDGITNGVEAILRAEAQPNRPSLEAWIQTQLRALDPYLTADKDGDSIPDDYETVFGLRTDSFQSSTADADNDGLPNRAEAQMRTWPSLPGRYLPVTGPPVVFTSLDHNANGVLDIFEPAYDLAVCGYQDGATPTFTPSVPGDTDGDGAWDGQEAISGSDPRDPFDRAFPMGQAQTGGSVSLSSWTSGYQEGAGAAFQWRRLNGLDSLNMPSYRNVDASAAAGKAGLLLPQEENLRSYVSDIQNKYDPQSWGPWQPNGESWYMQARFMHTRSGIQERVWTPLQYANTYGGERSKLTGFRIPYKTLLVPIDHHTRLIASPPTDEGPPEESEWLSGSIVSASRLLHATRGARILMPRVPSPPELRPPGTFSITSETGDVWSQYSWKEVWNYQEFYFGSGYRSRQYHEQQNGIPMTAGYNSGELYLDFEAPSFSGLRELPPDAEGGVAQVAQVAFRFPPTLKLYPQFPAPTGKPPLTVLEPNIMYDMDYFGGGDHGTVIAHAENVDNSSDFVNRYTVSISARYSWHNYEKIFGSPPPHNILATAKVEGPSLVLTLGKDTAPQSPVYSLNVFEEGGSRFRKIGLDGVPLADGKPQAGIESDSGSDETHVDALNLTLFHRTTDLHLPLASSDLALSADRTLNQETWRNFGYGGLPPAAELPEDQNGYLGSPFGMCWTTGLVPHLTLEVSLDSSPTEPAIATVVDEGGASTRFAMVRTGNLLVEPGSLTGTNPSSLTLGFIPLPAPADQTSLLNKLAVDAAPPPAGSHQLRWLNLTKRFGAAVRYELRGYSKDGNRLRFHYRVRSSNQGTTILSDTWGVMDRYGNKLHYSYPLVSGEQIGRGVLASPAELASWIVPSQITERDSQGRRLRIYTDDASDPLPELLPYGPYYVRGRFIKKVILADAALTPLQETEYVYTVKPLSEYGAAATNFLDTMLVSLSEVRRKSGIGVDDYIPQSFEYEISYDPKIQTGPGGADEYFCHAGVSKIRRGKGEDATYHRFDTRFDRSRASWRSEDGGSPQQVVEQGVDRPLTAVFFGKGSAPGIQYGKELPLSEFQPQIGKNNIPAPPYLVENLGDPSTPPKVDGSRVNTVVDADRRVRYYTFSQPLTRDSKAFQNLLFPQTTINGSQERTVLLTWQKMEIDHTMGATETYVFAPDAMMALKSSAMTLPSDGGPLTTLTEWEYKSPFKASAACSFLAGKTLPGGQALETHSFFAKWYPDPTAELKALTNAGAFSTPGEGSQLMKRFTYWADLFVPADNSRPWSRTMVKSESGYRADSGATFIPVTRTLTTLQTTGMEPRGLPTEESVYTGGALTATTKHYYGAPPPDPFTPIPASNTTSSPTNNPAFRWRTDIEKGIAPLPDGSEPLSKTPLMTVFTPDAWWQLKKTVIGNGNQPGSSSTSWSVRNALGQVVANSEGQTAEPTVASTFATRFTYLRDGRLASVTQPDPGGDGASVFPPGENVVATTAYAYDSLGRKTLETRADGGSTTFTYDDRGRLLRSMVDLAPLSNAATPGPEDLLTTSAFSPTGLLLRQTSPNGLTTEFQYDWLRRVVLQRSLSTDSVHGVLETRMGYDGGYSGDSLFSASSFKPTWTEGPFRYSGGAAAARTLTTYDSAFRKVWERTEYAPGAFADLLWGYDALGRCISSLDADGKRTTYTYNALGNITQVSRPNGLGSVQTMYTSAGLPIQVTETVPALSTSGGAILQQVQTRVTATTYDPAGRIKGLHLPAAGSNVCETLANKTFGYDDAGRQTSQTSRQSAVDPALKWTTEYDGRGRAWKTVSPAVPIFGTAGESSPVVISKYDRMDRVTWIAADPVSDGEGVTNPQAALKVYDLAGRMTKSVTPVIPVAVRDGSGSGAISWDSRIVTRTVHDNAGNPVRVQSGIVLSASLENPPAAPNNPAPDASVWAAAAGIGGGVGNEAPAQGETVNIYDQRGRLLSTKRRLLPVGTDDLAILTESFEYDEAGNRTRVIDAAQKQTGFTYDPLGRVLTTVHNAGDVVANRDVHSNLYSAYVLKQSTDAHGKQTVYQYDGLNRLRTVDFDPGTPAVVDETHYFNSAGEKVGVVHTDLPWKDTAYSYDRRGRLVSETSLGYTHSHEYDQAGNRTLTTYGGAPGSRKLTSSYDRLGRLGSVTETLGAELLSNGRVTQYGYDLRGNTRGKELPNGTSERKDFDLADRAVSHSTTAPGAVVLSTNSLSYDRFGNLLRQHESRPAISPVALATRTVVNTYDLLSRLLKEEIYPSPAGPATSTTYTYDAAGNRTNLIRAPTGGTETYDYTSASLTVPGFEPSAPLLEVSNYRPNQLRKITRTDGPSTSYVYFRYDKNGNRTRKYDTLASSANTAHSTYFWNRLNRLERVTAGSASGGTPTHDISYAYDARGRRITRTQAGQPNEFESFAGGLAVSQWTGSLTGTRSLTLEYIRGSDFGGGVGGVLYTIDNLSSGAKRFYEYGARGDVTGHSSETGSPVYRASYKAFGDHTDSGTAGPGRQRASTKDEEPLLGLLNEGFRYRDIQSGSFISRDPAGFVDGPNLYSYVRQNPWSKFDPHGLWEGSETKHVTRTYIQGGVPMMEYNDTKHWTDHWTGNRQTWSEPATSWQRGQFFRQGEGGWQTQSGDELRANYGSNLSSGVARDVAGRAKAQAIAVGGGVVIGGAGAVIGPAALLKEAGSEAFEQVTGVPTGLKDLAEFGVKKLAKEGLADQSAKKLVKDASLLPTTTTGNYRARYVKADPGLPEGWAVHHTIPQKYQQLFEDIGMDIGDLQHLRGVDPKIHSRITTEWGRFDKRFGGNPTAADVAGFVRDIDRKFEDHLRVPGF